MHTFIVLTLHWVYVLSAWVSIAPVVVWIFQVIEEAEPVCSASNVLKTAAAFNTRVNKHAFKHVEAWTLVKWTLLIERVHRSPRELATQQRVCVAIRFIYVYVPTHMHACVIYVCTCTYMYVCPDLQKTSYCVRMRICMHAPWLWVYLVCDHEYSVSGIILWHAKHVVT